jgi:hypothetical protein
MVLGWHYDQIVMCDPAHRAAADADRTTRVVLRSSAVRAMLRKEAQGSQLDAFQEQERSGEHRVAAYASDSEDMPYMLGAEHIQVGDMDAGEARLYHRPEEQQQHNLERPAWVI